MPITNVVFDAVGTVICPKTSVSRTYWEAGSQHGSRRSLSEIERAFWPTFDQVDSGRLTLETSERAERSFWNDVVSAIFTDVDVEGQTEILGFLWNHYAKATSWELYPDALDTLRNLQRAGVRLAIASNFDSRLRQICQDLFPQDVNIQVFESASIGFRKPAMQFFQRVATDLGCPVERLVMIGDNLEADVRGAKNSGWHALLIDRRHNASQGMMPSTRNDSAGAMHTLAAVPSLLAEIV